MALVTCTTDPLCNGIPCPSPPVLLQAPAFLPVSLDEAKAQLRIYHSDDDDEINRFLATATQFLDGPDGVLGRCLCTQKWRQDFTAFDGVYGLRLPLKPIVSVDAVKYYDGDNAHLTLGTGLYQLSSDARGSYVALVSGSSWPSSYSRADAVGVEFTAGYGDPLKVPAPIRQEILARVTAMYATRTANSEIPLTHAAALRRFPV